MSLVAPRNSKFSPKAKGWAVCIAVGAAATVATVTTPEKASAYERWTAPSGQRLTWRSTGYAESNSLEPYTNPIQNNTSAFITKTQSGVTGDDNIHGLFAHWNTGHFSEPTTAPDNAFTNRIGYNLMNGGTGTAGSGPITPSLGYSTWWVKASFIDNRNTDGSWPSIGMHISDNSWSREIQAFAGYPRGYAGVPWQTQSGTNITAGPYSVAGYSIDNAASTAGELAEMGLITNMLKPSTNRMTVSYQTTTGQNNATNAGAADLGIPYANRVGRVDGAAFSVRIGKLQDNTIEITWEYNGVTYPTYSNTWYVGGTDFTIAHLIIGDRHLQTGDTITYTDFAFGGDYTTQVPEPASLALLGVGGMLVLARRRKA